LRNLRKFNVSFMYSRNNTGPRETKIKLIQQRLQYTAKNKIESVA